MEPQDANKYVTPAEACLLNVTDDLIGLHCNATWDTITCWPPTMALQTAKQACPYIFGALEDTFVYKTCGSDGHWTKPEMWSGFGYSDYSECIAHLSMIHEIFDIQETEDRKQKINSHSLEPITITEISLLTVSLLFLIIVIMAINCALPKSVTQAAQYKISRNLYSALLLETILHTVQIVLIIFETLQEFGLNALTDSAIVCELLISTREYCNGTFCMWLFLQAYHLKMVSFSRQPCTSGYQTYCLIGWGIPVIPVIIWVVALSLSYKVACWIGYKYLPITWILESSRLLMAMVTLICLLVSMKQLLRNSSLKSQQVFFQGIYFDNVTSILYFIFIAFSMICVLLENHWYQRESENWFLSTLCTVLVSSKGVIMSCIFLTMNVDIRKFLQTKFRLSDQRLVSSARVDSTV